MRLQQGRVSHPETLASFLQEDYRRGHSSNNSAIMQNNLNNFEEKSENRCLGSLK